MDPKVAQEIQAFDQEPWIPVAWKRGMLRGGLLFLVVAVGVGGFLWRRHVTAPSPAEICEHKIALTRAETAKSAQQAGEKLIQKLQSSCESSAKRRIRLEGKVAYARFARCVIKARTLSETELC